MYLLVQNCWTIHRTVLAGYQKRVAALICILQELHIILAAKIQLQPFLQRLVTFRAEISQINQYAGLLHSQ